MISRRVMVASGLQAILFVLGLLTCNVLPRNVSLAADMSNEAPIETIPHLFRLRADGKYVEALELAREDLEASRRCPHPDSLAIARMKRFVESLEFIINLPPASQKEMAEADSLWQAAQDCWVDGSFSASAELCRQRLEILHRHFGEPTWDVARTLQHLAVSLASDGDLARAKLLLYQTLEILMDLLGPEHTDVAWTLEHLGMLHASEGQWARAEELYRETLGIWFKYLHEDQESLMHNENVIRTLDRLAKLYIDQGDYAKAIPLLRRGEVASRGLHGGQWWLSATVLSHLAIVLQRQGDYAAAEPLFREALGARRKDRLRLGADHPHVVRSLTELGEVLCQCGEPAAAEPFLQEALAKSRKTLGDKDPRTATVLLSLASLRRSTGDYAAAESLAREALAIHRQASGNEDLSNVAACLSHLAETYAAEGKSHEAVACFREALPMYTHILGRDHPNVVQTMHDLGRCFLALHEPAAAEPLLLEAASSFEIARLRVGSGYSRATFETSPYTALAVARLMLRKDTDAWPAAERALGRALADLMIAAGRRLTPTERAVHDSLEHALSHLEGQLAALEESARSNTSEQVAQNLGAVRIRLAAAEGAWSDFQTEIASRHAPAEGQTFALERIQKTLTERTALIGWLYLELSKEESASWGYVIRSEGPVRWVPLSTPRGENDFATPAEKARDFRDALALAASWAVRPVDVTRITGRAADLWDRWIAPLTVYLDGVDNLVVVPSGPMQGIPIEALVDSEDTYLADHYTISYAPSATLYTWLWEQGQAAERDRSVDRKALLVGDPPFTADHLTAMGSEPEREPTPGATLFASSAPVLETTVLRSALAGNQQTLADLPRVTGTREEVRRLAALIPAAEVLLGPDASEQRLTGLANSGALRGFDTIHLATHARADDERPERSALVFSRVDLPDPYEAVIQGTRVYDGLLTASEIVREWDLDADLVTLSGCQTGLGRETAGEGYVGLAHAFLQAGARSVVVSLWKVEDEVTTLLMSRFYENLTGSSGDRRNRRHGVPMSKAEALREAKQWVRDYRERPPSSGKLTQPFRHPSYWSGFVLIGEP